MNPRQSVNLLFSGLYSILERRVKYEHCMHRLAYVVLKVLSMYDFLLNLMDAWTCFGIHGIRCRLRVILGELI